MSGLTRVDPAYEFDCPRYRDFDEADDEHADTWFSQGGKVSDAAEVMADHAADMFGAADEDADVNTSNTSSTSTLTMPIRGLQLATETTEAASATTEQVQADKTEVTAVVEEAAAPTAAVDTSISSAVEEVAAPVEEQQIVSEVAATEAEVSDEAASSTLSHGFDSESGSVNVSVNVSGSMPSGLAEDELLDPTDEISFSGNDDDVEPTGYTMEGSRGSMVFSSAMKRSSLPMLGMVQPTEVEMESAPEVTTPMAEAAAAANNTSAEAEAEAAATDIEVEALQQSLVEAPVDTAIDEEANNVEMQMEDDVEAEADAEVEMESAPQSIMEQFMAAADGIDSLPVEEPLPAVASTARITRSMSLAAAPNGSPSTSRRATRDLSSTKTIGGGVPSFLRPTAAALAKKVAAAAATAGVAAASTERPMITSRRTMAPSASTSRLNAVTPKVVRKRPATTLDELARPKTAVKRRESEAAPAPSTSRKHSMHASVAPKLTIAQSPALSTRARAKAYSNSLISTEEEEVRRIAAERDAVAKEMKAHAKAYAHQAEHGHMETAPMTARAINLTQPEEFHFQTSKRAKVATLAAVDLNAGKDTSRKHSVAGGEPTLTKVQPFSLHTSARTRPSKPAPLSQAELDAQVMASMPKFKALPLNKDIFTSGGEMGVPRIQKAKLTDPTSPNLATKERGNKRKQEEENKDASAAPTGPSASPAPKSAKKPRASVAPGVFIPFNLATEERGRKAEEEFERKRAEAEAAAEAARLFHARRAHIPPPPTTPAPQTARAPIQAHSPKCAEKSRLARQKLEAEHAAAAARAAELTKFKARPNPFAHTLAASESPATVAAAHALPTFEAKRSDRPLTAPVEVVLASDGRAERRAEWEAALAASIAEQSAAMEVLREESEQTKAKELAAYRRSLVLKAHPAPNMEVVSFVPKPSTAKLTQPESPMLITKRRATTARHMPQLAEEVAEPIEPMPMETFQ